MPVEKKAEPLHMRFGRTGAKTTAKIVEKAIPVPFVDKMTGWAVEESIVYLLERAEAIRTFREDCKKLKELLSQGNNAHRNQSLLEEMADMPALSGARGLLMKACEALTEVNFVVAVAEARKAQGLMSGAMHRAMSSFTSKARKRLKDAVEELSSDADFLQWRTAHGVQTLVQRSDPGGPSVYLDDQELRELEPRLEGEAKPKVTRQPELPGESIVQHCDGFLSDVYNLLGSVRNVLIVGMGGIGKTTVARAMCERADAAQQFDQVVWLNVGQRPNVLELLIDAFSQLFGAEWRPDFEEKSVGVRRLARRIRDRGWSVLLVLDDVWAISEPGVIDALNFATIVSLGTEGSRLIVTTRQACAALYASRPGPTTALQYEVVEVPPLSIQNAQQLFHHQAFKWLRPDCWADDRLCPEQRTRMIHACGGNPGAVMALGDVVRNTDDPDAWAGELKRHEDQEVWEAQPPHTTWASSVDALPESVKACFIAFAAFQPESEATEADVLHLFATSAPLHTPESVRAAGSKLEQLVQHNLVSASRRDGRWLFSMHPILRRIARSRAGQAREPEGPALYHFEPAAKPSKESLGVQCLSVHKAQDTCVSEALQNYRHEDHKLHVCVISQVKRTPPPDKWPPRLRYLRLGRQWACGWKKATPLRAKMIRARTAMFGYTGTACPAVLHSLSLPSSSTVSGEPLQCLLPARQLLHLDLSGCASLTELPPCVPSCTQLVHLNLHGCSRLLKLPEEVGDCTSLLDLDLGGCQCLQKLPERIGDCTNLIQLDMSGCSDESQQDLPVGIVCCINLMYLDLSGCLHLTRLTTGRFTTAMQLTHIDLSKCSQLESLPSTIGNCRSLQHLNLSECSSLTEVPDNIGDCTKLTALDLSGCTRLTGLPQTTTDLIELAHLDLSSCHRLAVFPPSLGGCVQLTHVGLCNNAQLQHVPAAISSHVNLAHVDFSGCAELQQLPQPFQSTQLTRIDLCRCSRLQSFPNNSHGYSNLMHIDAEGSSLRLPQWIGSCSQLTHLNLKDCSNLTELPQSICSCSDLAHLCLSGCSQLLHLPDHIGGLGPVIEGCRHLSHIDLSGCIRLAQLPPSITDCSELAHICLSGCSQLTELPGEISRCSQLTHLDLSDCTSMPEPPHIIAGDLSYLGLKRSCSLILQNWHHVAVLPQGIVGSLGPQVIELDLSECATLTELPSLAACKQLTRLCLRKCSELRDVPPSIGDCALLNHMDLTGCPMLQSLPARVSNCRLLRIKIDRVWRALFALNPNDAALLMPRLEAMFDVQPAGGF